MLHRILGAALLVLIGILMAYKFTALKGPDTGPALVPVSYEAVKSQIESDGHKIVLINYWASWCVPCLKEFPELLALRKKFADQGLNVIFISADTDGEKAAAERFLQRQGVDFPSFYREKAGYEVFDQLYPGWNGALPSSLIYDRSGKLLEAWFGETSGAEFERRVQKYL